MVMIGGDGWRSPFEIVTKKITNSLESQLEQTIAKIIVDYDLKVDIDELKELIEGDRNQYKKGYEKGYVDGYGRCFHYEKDKIWQQVKATAVVEKYKKCKECKWFESKKQPCEHFWEGEGNETD